jgi:hypothetical protein
MGKLYDNGCHVLSRDDCYLNHDKRYEVWNKLFKLQNAHIFKDAVPCAEKVFSNNVLRANVKRDITLAKRGKLSFLE